MSCFFTVKVASNCDTINDNNTVAVSDRKMGKYVDKRHAAATVLNTHNHKCTNVAHIKAHKKSML